MVVDLFLGEFVNYTEKRVIFELGWFSMFLFTSFSLGSNEDSGMKLLIIFI